MKAILATILFTCSVVFANTKISEFQWKNRLLIISGATKSKTRTPIIRTYVSIPHHPAGALRHPLLSRAPL